MTTSSPWAEYTPSSSSTEAELEDAMSDAAYSTVWTHVSAAADPFDEDFQDSFDTVASDPGGGDEADYPPGATRLHVEATDTEPSSVGEYVAMPGVPGRGVCLLTLVALGGCAAADLALARGITMFFDLCFVTVCLVASMSVRRRDLFTTGVLPPLVFAAVVGAVAVLSPGTFVQFGGAFKAFMTGLAEHAPGLVAGYAVALVTVGSRVGASRAR
jgi:Domain of unknown function (DUF6542)